MSIPAPVPRVVAVLNSNDDLVNLIRDILHGEGYLSIGHHISDLRDGHSDISRFLEDRDPSVIIYDLAPPFTLNWQFLALLRKHPAMQGRTVILTTNNAVALRDIVGVDAMQIVGSDTDLRALVDAVNEAFRERERPARPRRAR